LFLYFVKYASYRINFPNWIYAFLSCTNVSNNEPLFRTFLLSIWVSCK
jgi:hypothetical protein